MKTGRGWWALAGVSVLTLLGLPALYAATYYQLVHRSPEGWPEYEPVYDVPMEYHATVEWLFTPIHRFDVRQRPDFWFFVGMEDQGPDEPEIHPENSN